MKNDRLTLGYLAEASFENFQIQMLEGVIKAAREKDINLLFFTMEHEQRDRTYKHQMEYIYSILERVELDGLMFLGWTLRVVKNERSFLKRIQSIKKMPVVSLGRRIENVPSVIINADKHLTELLAHLYDYHNYRNIVFIQPITSDERYICYENFMKERGIFKPELVVKSEDCYVEKDYYTFNRAKKIVNLLFDERKAPVDALISMYTHEAAYIMDNLIARGYKVPGDVAIVSWEDDDRAKYAKSPITAVYFPFFEIGYAGCKKITDIIDGVDTGMATVVPAKIYFRNSCGCKTLDELNVLQAGAKLIGVSADSDRLLDRYRKIKHEGPQVLNGEELLEILNLEDGIYLECLGDYINKTLENNDFYIHVRAINVIHDIQKEIFWFYSFVSANFTDPKQVSKAEKMVLKVLLLLQQKTEFALVYNEALKRGSSDLIQDTSQNIVTTYDIRKINRVLYENMLKPGL